jgi:hypothetical protein
MPSPKPGYVVLQRLSDDTWRVIGEVDRRPGLPARKSREQAILDATGAPTTPDGEFRVLPKSEWRLAAE